MKLNIAVLPGDGIGPEVTNQAIKALEAVGDRFNHFFIFKEALIGAAAIEKTGIPLPDETLELCSTTDAILFGAIGAPKYDKDPMAKVRPEQGLLKLRKSLGLYANIRPIKAYNSILKRSPLRSKITRGIDICIYRELTGGIYFGKQELSDDGKVASDLCQYSQAEIERIAHLAFKDAQKRRKKLTLVDKANILESSRLWRRVVNDLASQYPEVEVKYMFVDNAASQLLRKPSQFDVILTDNMFGDILSEAASVIGGSIGILPSASIGERFCMFDPFHSSFNKAAGKGIANPIAAILSAAMLLEHFDLIEEAKAVRTAVEKALELNLTTRDLNKEKPFTTEKVGDFIGDYIREPQEGNINYYNIYMGQSTII